MRIYYKNSSGKILDLMKWPYRIKKSEFLDHEWSYTEKQNEGQKSGGKITGFRKKIEKSKVALDIFAMSKKEYQDAVDYFLEVTESDVLAEVPGRLYVGEYYYSCFIYASEKKQWERMTTYLQNEIKIVSPYPFWCHEETMSFLKYNPVQARSVGNFLKYPYGYPYQYPMPKNVGIIQNDHYAACDFKMIVYGPCTDPAVMISGHLYEVVTTLFENEYMVIDSRNNTVVKFENDGLQKNLFNSRNKDSNLFQKIPSGNCSVLWNTDLFGFDVTLFQERSEPKWIL